MHAPYFDGHAQLPPPPAPPWFDGASGQRPSAGAKAAYTLGLLGLVSSAVGLALGVLTLIAMYQAGTECTTDCGGYGFYFVFVLMAMGGVVLVGLVSLMLCLTGRSRMQGRS